MDGKSISLGTSAGRSNARHCLRFYPRLRSSPCTSLAQHARPGQLRRLHLADPNRPGGQPERFLSPPGRLAKSPSVRSTGRHKPPLCTEYPGVSARARSSAMLASAPSPHCHAVNASRQAGAATYLGCARRTRSVHRRRCASRYCGSIRAQASSRIRKLTSANASQACWSNRVIDPPTRRGVQA
jgi:hypothetical protein